MRGHKKDTEQIHNTRDNVILIPEETTSRENTITPQSSTITEEAKRFALSRYPFSPFIIMLEQKVQDKFIVEFLCKSINENHHSEIEVAGYRGVADEEPSGGYKILLFVKNTESFATLMDQKVWPQDLGGHKFKLTIPSIPPQLAVVLPDVPMNISWEEFVEEIKANHENIVSMVRLRNRYQQEIKAVKIEFKSVVARNKMLERNRIYAMGLSLEVVEYLAQAHVLICSQCMKIGHFRKNCPQKNEYTCSTCGDKCEDIKAHKTNCSKVSKCIHCGGAHKSNDSKCPKIKEYRAALTKSLLKEQGHPEKQVGNIPRRDLVKEAGTSFSWITQSRGLPEILEWRCRKIEEGLHLFKVNICKVMDEVCDMLILVSKSTEGNGLEDRTNSYGKRTETIKALVNTLQTQVLTSSSICL